ncbi:MAG: hypothetical protein PHZ19_00570 [Candidatus Thermoplasmatota archaeon]|nr:hypothetical protein [Candidatus Thermoplasmatota archaeon]
MDSKTLCEYKKRYRRYHHHAWAGGIMLSLLLALRIFLEISGVSIDDRVMLLLGVALILYISLALALTYRYRSGLDAAEEQPPVSEDVERARLEAEVERERIRAEEEAARAEAKVRKKAAKAAAKARKKELKEQEKKGG